MAKVRKNPRITRGRAQRGYAALIAVVIISAASLIIAKSISWSSLGMLDMNFTASKSLQARSIADGCLEDYLERLSLHADLPPGSLVLISDDGQCILDITDTGENAKQIEVQGIVGDYGGKIVAQVSTGNGQLRITGWQEY